jgi:hypothetical protein
LIEEKMVCTSRCSAGWGGTEATTRGVAPVRAVSASAGADGFRFAVRAAPVPGFRPLFDPFFDCIAAFRARSRPYPPVYSTA